MADWEHNDSHVYLTIEHQPRVPVHYGSGQELYNVTLSLK